MTGNLETELRKAQAEADKAQEEYWSKQYSIAGMLRARRHGEKVKLRDLARELGCSAPYLSDLERGRRNLSPEWIERHEKALKKLAGRKEG